MRVSFGFSRGGLILPPVRIQQKTLCEPDMALDTGARVTVITPRLARELGLEPDEMTPTVKVVSATGSADATALTVASVSILTAEVRDLRVVCHALPGSLGLDGVLGLNFLNHFNVEINSETESVTLTEWHE